MISKLTTPQDLLSPSLSFARAINTDSKLEYIQVRPSANALANECYSNVENVIKERGGKRILGWQIWEWPGFFAEAEAHAIWQSQEYELYDVSPKAEHKIAFIADPNLKLTGNRIDNLRHALADIEVVHDFIKTGKLKHGIFGSIISGTKLDTWQVVIGGRLDNATWLLPHLFKAEGNINQRCPCSSGLSYAACHRSEVRRTLEMATKAVFEQ